MKKERFEMRLDPQMVHRVDDWSAVQPDRPSRAEAMRRLAEAGLAVLGKDGIRISHGEALTLMMLRDLCKHLKAKGEIDPDFVEEAICDGHYWGLEWKYPGLFHGQVDREEVLREVLDVLNMWHSIESGYNCLSDDEKKEVEEKVGPQGKNVRFPGFDGNNESEHLGIAGFLINRLNRFTSFRGRDLNSHYPTLRRYRPMCQAFDTVNETLIGRELSGSEIIDLLKARS